MKQRDGKLIFIIVILLILVCGLSGYIVYDNLLKEDVSIEQGNNNTMNENDDNNSEGNRLTDEEASELVKESVFNYINYHRSLGPYCGEYNSDDYIEFGSYENNDFRSYFASKTYKSIADVKKYYATFMVEGLFPKYLSNGVSYIEQDGKLYCQLSNKGPEDKYNYDFGIKEASDKKIVADISINEPTFFLSKGTLTLIKDSSGKWLVSEDNMT